MPKRLLISVAREGAEHAFRVTVNLRLLVVLTLLLVGSPLLLAGGAVWGARAVIADLLRQNSALQIENASYRDATAELVAQVTDLQTAADELRSRSEVDPQAARAMEKLPRSITHRAMGGVPLDDVTTRASEVASAGDPAFGLLRDVLHLIQAQLDRVRSGAERRQALAAATPSIWPVAGGLTSQYGSRTDPFTGSQEFHAGLDISANSGEPVRATADGTVTIASWRDGFGNLVVIDHGFGISTRYGHLSRFAVMERQNVRKGDVVGFVGSTGRSTSPHVHYELLLNGRPANPLRLLAR